LARAIDNLLDNAIRHTPAGGRIEIDCRRDGQRVLFTVTDTGPGIAQHDLPHLFTPLYRAETSRNRQTGGAGLGLTIARRILQAHGGDLTAANNAGTGAVFTAALPIPSAESAPIVDDRPVTLAAAGT
jgi:signal transduction histidine kinase